MFNIFSNESNVLTIAEEGETIFKSRNVLKIAQFLIEEKPEEVEAFIFNSDHDSFRNLNSIDRNELKELLSNQMFKENNFENQDDW